MARVVCIGSGAMGLSAAYRAAKNGHTVTVLEAAPDLGGMAGHFDFDGVSLERFYHFICKTDAATFALLEELGITDQLRWTPTSMGLFTRGRLFAWGDPFALLRFPHLTWVDKLRYALFAFVCIRRNSWEALESVDAKTWITQWCGERIYKQLWEPLLRLKFYELAENISAKWIWMRVRRIGRSRKSLLQEELGFLQGGTLTLVDALTDKIHAYDGVVCASTPVTRVVTDGGRVRGVQTSHGFFPADAVISTVPTPYVPEMIPSLPEDWKARYRDIENIACICVVFRLKRSVSPHFWVNVSEPDIEVPGVIEFSHLRDFGGETIMYVPYYMPYTNHKFAWSDDRFVQDAFNCLQRINPALQETDLLHHRVARLRYGQPVCSPGFASRLPSVETPIEGLQVADTCFYYPEDRGISESIRLGEEMAERLGKAVSAAGTDSLLGPLADEGVEDVLPLAV